MAHHEFFYRAVVLGSGPAGLSAAVNLASEGISTVIVEGCDSIGGQAKHSSRIENFLGFPGGVSGPALMSRAESQALKFGAEFILGQPAVKTVHEGTLWATTLADNTLLVSKVVLIATGLLWRTLKATNIERFLGHGVYYGANIEDAISNTGKNVAVVGGANSAGQAALHFATTAAHVDLIVRADSLAQGMSEYLVERITETKNIKTHLNSSVKRFRGDPVTGVDGLLATDISKGVELLTDNAFIFIGAEPRTEWLRGVCGMDARGFLETAADHMTACAGLFAAGDVRLDSTKRIASAVGEGAHATSGIHRYLLEGVK